MRLRFSSIVTRFVLVTTLLALLSGSVPAHAVRKSTDLIGDFAPGSVPAQIAVAAPDVTLAAGVLVAPDGRELWSRSADERRAMASTTKIMTAVVTLENASLDSTFTVTSAAGRIGESVAGIKSGQIFTVAAMLEGTLVKSGNDAAEALAIHVGGSEAAFVDMMNAKALELGLTGTHYSNPHGLDESDHYTTARDLSVLSRYAMRNEDFRQIVGMPFIDMDGDGPAEKLETSNLLIGDYVGATGIKTGWTNDAGYCLAGSARRNGIELVAIVLGARSEQSRFDQAAELLDWGFEHYSPRVLASADETLGVVPVTDYLDVTIPALPERDLRLAVFDLDGEVERQLSLDPGVEAPVKRGDRVGTLTVRQGERLLAQVQIVAGADVAAPGFFERIWIALQRGWRSMTGG